MKFNYKILVVLAGLQITANAFAQTSSMENRDKMMEHTLKEQAWGLTPQIGQLSYRDVAGNYSSRATVGVSLDINTAAADKGSSDAYYGINIGAFYSHAGSPYGNFLDGNTYTSSSGTNVFLIPVDLKLGSNLSNSFRLSVQGGGNLIYRGRANAINLGSGSESSNYLWKVYPNAGISAELQLSRYMSLVAHPDVTFTNGSNLFVATIGATFIGY